MKSSKFRILAILAVLVLLVSIGAITLGAKPAGAAAVPVTVSKDGTAISNWGVRMPQEFAATRDWTAEEMKNAIPYPLEREGEGVRSLLPADDLQAAKEPQLIPGTLPLGERAAAEAVAPLSLGGISPLGYGYPAPFTRYENFDSYKTYPYKTVGKLFFTQYGVNYVCSASSIGNYAIWTAGHCIHAGDGTSAGWSYNVKFVPAYKDGSAPLGQWSYDHLWVSADWYYNGMAGTYEGIQRDYGGAVLKKLSRVSISKKVGSLGFAWNFGDEQHWIDIGYPQAAPFNGYRQQICAASYAYSDIYFTNPPYPHAIGCDLTGGSSGGPWILFFSMNGGYVNGNNSYRYSGYNNEMFSSYYDDTTYEIYACLVSSSPGNPTCP